MELLKPLFHFAMCIPNDCGVSFDFFRRTCLICLRSFPKADTILSTAYRQRKETTIAELNDKVAELEQTILKMNRTSVAFNNSAANSALPSVEPDLAHDLQTVALRFSARALSTNSNQTLESVEEVRTFSPRANQRGRDTDIAMKSDIQIAEATNHQLHAPQVTNSLTSSPWGYSFDAGPVNIQCGHVEEVTRDVSMNDFPCQPVSMNPPPAVRRDQRLVHFPVTVNEAQSLTLVSNKALAPPLTYCFKETTFARRLLRASYERACRVMSNPVTNAATIQNMCRFVFCFNNSANITKWVNKMACATTEDSLEMWVATQLHVGNAGLHYARTSLDGANEPPSFWANKAPMGPRRSTIAETPVPDSMTVEEIIEMVGFQGEWFDSNDVEHYLKSKGLVLDEQSSRVELDLDALPSLGPAVTSALGSPASSNPSTDPSSPKDADSMFPEVSVLRGGDQLWGAAVANLLDYTNDGVDTQVHEMPSEAKSLAASTPFFNDDYFYSREIKKSVIDVDKFVSSKTSSPRLPRNDADIASSHCRESSLPRTNSRMAEDLDRLSIGTINARSLLRYVLASVRNIAMPPHARAQCTLRS